MLQEYVDHIFLYLYGDTKDVKDTPYKFLGMDGVVKMVADFNEYAEVIGKYSELTRMDIINYIFFYERKYIKLREDLTVNYAGLFNLADAILSKLSK